MELCEVDREPAPPEEILEPDLRIVDAHQHLWPSGGDVPYGVHDFGTDLQRGHNIASTVFVECRAAYRTSGDEALRPVGETEFVVAETSAHPVPGVEVAAAIVGWADLMDPDAAARTIDAHIESGGGRFRGVRFNVVWDPRIDGPADVGRQTTPHMLLDDRYRAGLAELARRDLVYEVLLFHPQLPELATTLDAAPDLNFVINHLGGPLPDEPTAEGRQAIFDDWRRNLEEVARRPNVFLKIGGFGLPEFGFVTPGSPRPTSTDVAENLRPYFEVAVEAFGSERCMCESNFPVDKQSLSYDSVWNTFKLLCADYSPEERSHLLAETASSVYGIG